MSDDRLKTRRVAGVAKPLIGCAIGGGSPAKPPGRRANRARWADVPRRARHGVAGVGGVVQGVPEMMSRACLRFWWIEHSYPEVACSVCYGERCIRTGAGTIVPCRECESRVDAINHLRSNDEFNALCYDSKADYDSRGVLADWLEERGYYELADDLRTKGA